MPGKLRTIARRLVKGKRPAAALDVERAEQTFYIEYLRDGMVVFDVGANVGELTLLFSRFAGSNGVVHAFEASRRVFERLSRICELAGCTRAVLNHCAVADTVGTLKLHVYSDEFSGWNTLADRPLANYNISAAPVAIEDVPSTTVDAYCSEHGIERIDLLKIDVEGAEYQVLLGARRMLAERRIACCVFEFGQTTFDMGNRPSEIRRYLEGCGYSIRNVVKGDPVFPGGDNVDDARFSLHVAVPR
ncbi:MAG: FkbM family methyltransferase [Bacteroidetes bacterium]|nr:FkbM family methyltransferase [Bacteroidota bacterium]